MLIRLSGSLRAVLGLLVLVPLACGDSGEAGGGGSGGQAVGGDGGSGARDGGGGSGETGGGGSGASGASGGGGNDGSGGASGGGGMGGTGGVGGASGGGGMGGTGGVGGDGGTGGGLPPDCLVDGVLGPNEECDDDNASEGDGCDNDCTFSCSAPLADCPTASACNIATCDVDHVCLEVADPSQNGDSCGVDMVCADGACIASPVCGDSVRAGSEQCDGGDTTNLDGCDASCRFEQGHRIGYLKIQFGTDAYCTVNRFGLALTGGLIQGQLQSQLDTSVADGAVTNLFTFLNLDDLAGVNDASVTLGVLTGAPVAGAGYNGASDLDWWYTVSPASIDANRNPIQTLSGSITASALTTNPGVMTLSLFGAGAPPIRLSGARMSGTIGASSTPLSSAGATPGHLASENLAPALTSFATWGQQTTNGAAKLCGNVAAAPLATIPIPAALAMGGAGACSQGYQATNSLLDVIVGGCTIFGVPQVTPSQPDQVDPAMPAAGAGGPYTLTTNASRVVNGCRDVNNAVANLQACLDAAAYSSFFKFASGRVIVK
ncbi:MAG: hypothetical protein IPM79_12950 [Polyangiaceae bacterium]|nr:hypothetical protein [Polyangiaceae bacterium]